MMSHGLLTHCHLFSVSPLPISSPHSLPLPILGTLSVLVLPCILSPPLFMLIHSIQFTEVVCLLKLTRTMWA